MCNCDDFFTVLAGDTFAVAARFIKLGTVADPLLPADVSTVTLNTYAVSGNDRTLVDTDTVDVADVMFDTLQTNGQWLANTDSTGFNFIVKRVIQSVGRYHVDVLLVLTNGDPHKERWNIRVK